MANIPEHDIEALKSKIDLPAIVRSRGIELKPHGKDEFIGCCPFHSNGGSADFIVCSSKGLFHCRGCGEAGNVIEFVEKFDGLSFRHAFELLGNGGSAAFKNTARNGKRRKKTLRSSLPCPLDAEADDNTLLESVVAYYQERLPHSQAALDYLASRGLDDEDLLKRFRVGFADRTLGLRLPGKQSVEGKKLRSRLQELGVFRRESGHEHFNGSVVFPIFDEQGNVQQIYGRKITRSLRKGTPHHLYLPGTRRGVFSPQALRHNEIILCQSVIDALSCIRHGMDAATCIHGLEGFTDELFAAIQVANLDAVRIAYGCDERGEEAAQRDSQRMQGIGVSCYRVVLPMDDDVNSYLLSAGAEALKDAVRCAKWLGEGSGANTPPSVPLTVETGGAVVQVESTPEVPLTDQNKSSQPLEAAPPLLTVTGEHYQMCLGDRRYRVGNLERNGGLDSLKITLRLWHDEHFHIDQIDLCRDVDRRRFCERAAYECRLDPELIKRDLGKLLLACENAQEARLHAENQPAQPVAVQIPPEQREQAEEFLQAPDLIKRLHAAFVSAGIVGEEINTLTAYLAGTSRLLDKPLAIIVQSTSAAGKTKLMEAVLSFFPSEEQVKYSAMTGQSLYYLGEKNLKHKILAIVEEEGAEKAGYALKLLQSEGELTIASTGKDANTGRMKTEEYHVEGPVAIIFTTTSIDIDEELMNRCLILTVDESREQTARIHALQRKARTLEGLRLKKKRQKTLALLQNVQRLLKPVEVVNPFADELTFTNQCTRTRRDHEKYLTLIEAVTLLHQYQRPLEEDPEAGPHIKTTLEDIEVANSLAPEVLGRSLDEVPPQTRSLLEAVKEMVAELCKTKAIDQDQAHFTRRQVRERTGWSVTQVRVHLHRLTELEYLALRRGGNGSRHVYELLVDAAQPGANWHIGLLEVEKLRLRHKPDGVKGEADGG